MDRLILFLLLFFNLLLTPLYSEETLPEKQKFAILPDVKAELMVSSFPALDLEKNGYANLFALTIPQERYLNIGKEIILINHGRYLQALKQSREYLNLNYVNFKDYLHNTPELSVQLTESDQFFQLQFNCQSMNNDDCYALITENQELIQNDIQNNQVLYNRYLLALKQPIYLTPPFNFHYQPLRYETIKQLANLHLASIVILLEKKEIDQAFTDLLSATQFWKEMLVNSENLADTLFATDQLVTLFHLVNNIIDQPELYSYLDHYLLTTVIKSFNQEESEAIFTAINNDMKANLRALSLIDEAEINKIKPELNYNRATNLNAYHLHNQMMLQNLIEKKPQMKETPEFNDAMKEFGVTKIHYFEFTPIEYQPSINQYMNMISYHQLVRNKFRIKQRDITDIARFLTANAVLGKNPYTQTPLIWNPRTHQLSTDYIGKPDETIFVTISP